MNDLAEKALHGLDVARRQVRDRAVLSFAVAGALAGATTVVAGGIVGASNPTRPLTAWLGLQNLHAPRATDEAPAAVMLLGVIALIVLWLAVVRHVRRNPTAVSRIWLIAGAWAAPFALGPPLLDTGVYSYAAFGLLQRSGIDPYHSAPSALGEAPVVGAIDPGARGTPSGVGPLGTLVEHLSASIGRGSALAAVLALRVLAVAVAIWIGRLATELGRARPDRALSLTALNPLVLLFVVSAAHLDGLLAALVLAALVAAREGRWTWSVALACVAGSVSGPGFVAAAALIVAHIASPATIRPRRAAIVDLLTAAAVTCAFGFAVPDGFGWLSTIGKQFAAHTPFSIAGAVSTALTPVVRGASYDDLAVGGRVAASAALVCALAYLSFTTRRRPVEQTVGFALLALGLLGPVLYPWYLLWGLLCLAPEASGTVRVRILALTSAGCVLAPAGFSTTASAAITGALLCVVAFGTLGALLARRSRQLAPRGQPPEISRTAGRTSARYTPQMTAEISEKG